jgi:hypothetical protein
MMVPLSDPRCSLSAFQEFFSDPIEHMEATCAGLRYAMASARQEPVTDPDESAGNMLGLPSIFAITGVDPDPPRRLTRVNQSGEYVSPFTDEDKTLLPLDVCRATCRAILDAKSVEVMMAGDDFMQLTPMPNFCHAWVAKYRVDMNEGCIKEQVEISASDVIDSMKDGAMDVLQWDSAFMRFAHSVQAYRHTGYEMHTFGGFLFEELPLDVLSFFLTVRYVMCDGRELKSKEDFTVDVRTRPMSRAREAVALVLGQATEPEKQAFYKMMSECVVGDGTDPQVLQATFVRLMTEEYRVERTQRFQSLVGLVDVAFVLLPDIVEDPTVVHDKRPDAMRLLLEAEKQSQPRMVKSLRLDQMESIVTALFPCKTQPKETVAFMLYRSACALGRGVVDAYSLRLAIEGCGILHSTLRVQIHLLTSANVAVVTDHSERMLDWVFHKREDLVALGALGPIPWLLSMVKPTPLADSLTELTSVFFAITRMVVSCHVFFDTVPEVIPNTKGRAGLDECMRLSNAYEAMFAIIDAHFQKKDEY